MKTIQEFRKEKDWTQLELANLMKVTPSTIFNWENARNYPSAPQFRELARLFGVSMDEIALEEGLKGKAAA